MMPQIARAVEIPLLLDVQINGHAIGRIGQFISRDGMLLAQRSELNELGLRVPRSLNAEPDGGVNLSALSGLTWRIDQKTQTLYLVVSNEFLLPAILQADDEPSSRRQIESGIGATLNYDMVNTFASHQDTTNGALDLRVFSPAGVASSGFLVHSGGGAGAFGAGSTVRLDSAYTFADTATLHRYTVGDFITGGLAWTRPVRLEGIQVRSDFSMRPDLVTFPLPALSGSAAVPSTVEVLTNGNSVLSHQVEPGPFVIPQLPVVTGAGTISMTVTNALGQQVTVTQPFYASSELLAPGLQTLSGQAGAVRRNWGVLSNDFGKFAASGTYRRGLTSKLTVEGSAEGTPGAIMAGAGVVIDFFNLAVVNVAVAGSVSSGQTGTQTSAGVQRLGRRFSFGGSAIIADRNYRDIAALSGDPIFRRQFNADVGLSSRRSGSVGVAYAATDLLGVSNLPFAPALTSAIPSSPSRARVLTANYTIQVHRVSIYAADFHDFTSGGRSGLSVGMTIPLGRRTSVSLSVDADRGYGLIHAQRSAVTVGDWGYQAYVSEGDNAHEFAQLQYKSRSALLTAGIDHSGGQTAVVLETQGSLSVIDGALFPSNTVYDSFAIVDTNSLGHVRVLQENRDIGSTNSRGKLLVPDLRSFAINHIAIEPTDVAVDATIDFTTREVRPQDRSGVVIQFPVKISHAALLRVVDGASLALPVGGTVTLLSTGVTVPIGYEGEAYVLDLGPTNIVTIAQRDGSRCTITFKYRPVQGEIPTLGPLSCVEANQ